MSVVSMCYWNSTISVVATGGADSPDYVVALAEYCRLLELKNNSCGIHVNSMHNSRTHDAIDPGKLIPAMIHQCIN